MSLRISRLVAAAAAPSAVVGLFFFSPVSHGQTLDLSTSGAVGTINGAIFKQVNLGPAGTGILNSFLRVQASPTEQGYNTNFRPVEFDEKTDLTFTHAIHLSTLPEVTINGAPYREIILDANEPAAFTKSLIALDSLQVFLSATPDKHGYAQSPSNLGSMVYDLDAGGDHNVLLDANLAQGSGKADLTINLPESIFPSTGDPFVYTYVKFGATNAQSEGGFEELGARPPTIPNPIVGQPDIVTAPPVALVPEFQVELVPLINPAPAPVTPLPAAAPMALMTMSLIAGVNAIRRRIRRAV
jgi:hypothetical protein